VQSDLQVRVSTWRQRIDPVLSAEEDRSAFDIHDYGGTLLQRLEADDSGGGSASRSGGAPDAAVPFQRVVACDNPFEVARLFAAMLQLVNNRWAGASSQAAVGDAPASLNAAGRTPALPFDAGTGACCLGGPCRFRGPAFAPD
jgi:hypothetical protein